MKSTGRRQKGPLDQTLELTNTASVLAQRMQSPSRRIHCFVVMRGLDEGHVIRMEGQKLVVGRDDTCDVVINDEGISRHHARFTIQGLNVVIEDLGSTNGVFVNGAQVSATVLEEGDKVLLGRFTVLKYALQDELEIEFQEQIHESASVDSLTGALNRRSLESRLTSEWSFARRHSTDLSVLMLDVDHFKLMNDTYGHATGDQVLIAISEKIRGAVRMEDVFGRYGGEEFIVVVRGVGHAGAMGLARRLRMLIERMNLNINGEVVSVTVSIGVATSYGTNGHTPETLVRSADERLYAAKQHGRNRAVGDEGVTHT